MCVCVYIYIRHRKNQVKPYSSSWFLAACVATIVPRYKCFRLYRQDKSSESKLKFRLSINHYALNKGKFTIPPLFNVPEVLSSASDKAKLFTKNFSKNSNLDDLDIS